MHTPSTTEYSQKPEDLIIRIRKGESKLRDFLLEYYWNYILSVVSQMIGRSAESTDEFSVGLQAFNEAIDQFDETKNVSFLCFARLVINRRVIDYIRKSSRYRAEYPFTYFEVNDNETNIERFAMEQPTLFTDKLEIQEEVLEFKIALLTFGITLDDLVRLAPRHLDTKLLCITIAKKIVDNTELSSKLLADKKLPIAELLKSFQVNRKTIENHRKFIIALFLIFQSDMEIIKGYSTFLLKGAL